MSKFVNDPFGHAVEPAKTSPHTFKSGVPVDFIKTTRSLVETKEKELAGEIEKLSQETEPPLTPKEKKLLKRNISKIKREISNLKKQKVLIKDPTDYFKMSKDQYNKFRKDLESSFPKGLERKYMVDKGFVPDDRHKEIESSHIKGKIDPRGGGAPWYRKTKKGAIGASLNSKIKSRATEEEYYLAKEHYARLVAGFCEVVTKYWELSPYIKNPKVVVTSYARGFTKKGLGNHDFGFAADSRLDCQYNGSNYTIPVLQYYNSIALLCDAGRLPRSKIGLYLNVGTSVAHEGPVPRPISLGERNGIKGPSIDEAGYSSKGGIPGASAAIHYDFEGYFGVFTIIGKARTTKPRYYMDLDLDGNGQDDLYSSSKGSNIQARFDAGKFVRGTGNKDKPYGGWNMYKNFEVLRSEEFNRKEQNENLKDVVQYVKRAQTLFKNGKVRYGKPAKYRKVVPFDNFLHQVDERVPNLFQVLGLEGEQYVKELGLDK